MGRFLVLGLTLFVVGVVAGCAIGPSAKAVPEPVDGARYQLIVLGTAQDGGIPQAGSLEHPAFDNPNLQRRVASLGIFDQATAKFWIIDATPDFPAQIRTLQLLARDEAEESRPMPAGIFLTHAHIGHYTGLMWLGHEAIGASNVPVYAMPRMSAFLANNGPWSQLVKYDNIALKALAADEPVEIAPGLTVSPLPVPHRQEFSEVVGYRIEGPGASVLYIPDIDSWDEWDAAGVRIEDEIANVDIALLDATFFDGNELPGRDMSGFPHPFITTSMQRFGNLPDAEKTKIRFTHLNHSNAAARPGTLPRAAVERGGFHVAEDGEVHPLGTARE